MLLSAENPGPQSTQRALRVIAIYGVALIVLASYFLLPTVISSASGRQSAFEIAFDPGAEWNSPNGDVEVVGKVAPSVDRADCERVVGEGYSVRCKFWLDPDVAVGSANYFSALEASFKWIATQFRPETFPGSGAFRHDFAHVYVDSNGRSRQLAVKLGLLLFSVSLVAALAFHRGEHWRGQPPTAGSWQATTLLFLSVPVLHWLYVGFVPMHGQENAEPINMQIGVLSAASVLALAASEELLFRVWLISYLERHRGLTRALILSALAFAVMHFPTTVSDALFLLVSGGFLSLLWAVSRSMIICILCHGLANLGALMISSSVLANRIEFG